MIRDRASAKTERLSDTVIDVSLKERSYQIVVGKHLIGSAGRSIAAAVPGARCVVVSDANIAALYLEPLAESLEREKIYIGQAIVAPGETSKSFAVLAGLSERLLEIGVERGDWSLLLAAAWSAISQGSPQACYAAAFASCRSLPRCWRKSIPRSAARPASTRRKARTSLAPSISRAWCSPTPLCWHAARARVPLGLRRDREIRAAWRCGLLRLARKPLAGSLPASSGAGAAIATSVAPRPRSSGATRPRRPANRALLNLGHTFGHALEAGPVIRTGCCMAKPSPSACASRSISAEHGTAGAATYTVSRRITAVGLPTRIADIPGSSPRRRGCSDHGTGQEGT